VRIHELIVSPKIGAIAKINLGFADFSISQAILAQLKENETI